MTLFKICQWLHAQNIRSASGRMSGLVAGENIPFSLNEPDIKSTCNNDQKLTCSLKSGRINTFSTNVPIQKGWPTLSVPIQWTMVDEETQKVVLCAKFRTKIVD
uniref:MD-2-related lipid-recognition domain-containing protein n=1 Tax=Romanomermis culicivorax TaxID=13658 RepID=A0A915HKQ7_ROMCU